MPRLPTSPARVLGLLLAFTPALAAAQVPPAAPTAPAPAPAPPPAAPLPAPSPIAAPPPSITVPAPALPPAAPAEKKPKKDGFRVQSADGRSELRVGGYVHMDGRFFLKDADDVASHELVLRRAHIVLEGTLFERLDFRLMPDVASGRLSVQDAYLDFKIDPAFAIRVGKMKSPFGLERLAPVTALALTELAFPTALAPNRDIGASAHGEIGKGTLSYEAGVFNGAADGASTDGDFDDDKDVVGRVFVRPFAATSVTALRGLGFGMAGSWGKVHGDPAATGLPTIKSSGQLTIASFVTGDAPATTSLAWGTRTRLGPQGNFYLGPVGLYGEYTRTKTDVRFGEVEKALTLSAYQVAGRFVVTGEEASEKGVTPKKGVTSGGHGAVELATRYHTLKVGSEAETAGFVKPEKGVSQAKAFGVGVNYYLEKGIVIALDYERTTFTGGKKDDGNRANENVLLSRVQLLF